MSRLWKWIDSKDFTYAAKMRTFMVLNCIIYSVVGFFVWLIVSRFALSTWDWAFCFIGYPGYFIGFIGGYIFLCRN